MALSEEARRRFTAYVEETDLSNTNPADDNGLLEFVAWALVHEPAALEETFAYQSVMSTHGLTDEKMRYIQTIVRAAPELIAALEHERGVTAMCDGLLVETSAGDGECDQGEGCQALPLRDDREAYRAAHGRVITAGQAENREEYGGEA